MIDLVILSTAGLIIGSFLSVVVTRGPAQWGLVDRPANQSGPYNIAVPRSHCPACSTQLTIIDLIPLAGFMRRRGRCRTCGTRISLLYPTLELGTAVGGAVCALAIPSVGGAVAALAFLCLLIALAAIDFRTGYLPDALTFPLIGLGLAVNSIGMFSPFMSAAAGVIVGGGALWLLAVGYRAYRGYDGLGLGDAKLLAGIGAWCGIASLPFVVLVASLSALIAVGIGALRKQQNVSGSTEIRFGPYLSAAGAIVFFANAAL